MTKSTIDVELLRKLLRYEPETGKLYWLPRPREMFTSQRGFMTWNSRFSGKEALTADNGSGYKIGPINYRMHRAHRVAWAIHTGKWPKADIDHINRNRVDNRIANLREATRAENMRNTVARENSTSKYLGVSWNTTERKWVAHIRINGRAKHIGRFKSEREAAAAYDKAALKMHGDFVRLNIPPT